jgi:hypothetical protein
MFDTSRTGAKNRRFEYCEAQDETPAPEIIRGSTDTVPLKAKA